MAVRDERDQTYHYIVRNNKMHAPRFNNALQTGDGIRLPVFPLAVEVMIENTDKTNMIQGREGAYRQFKSSIQRKY